MKTERVQVYSVNENCFSKKMQTIKEEVVLGAPTLDRNSFFLGLAIAVAFLILGYFLYNKFVKDAAKGMFASRPASQPSPPLLEKSPYVKDVENDGDAEFAMSATGAPKVVLVHAPWCGHCRNMMPAFVQAASKEFGVQWIRADGNVAPTIVNRSDLRGFPTIYGVTASGVITQHNGPRDDSSLVKFAKSLMSKEVETSVPVVVRHTPPSAEFVQKIEHVEELDEESEEHSEVDDDE